jgi:BolA family transcriptional regulator, general stress-responsive regulator
MTQAVQANRTPGLSRQVALPQLIAARLADLNATTFDLTDESSQHVGHAGAGGGGHFRLVIVSSAFTDLNRVARHRAVYGRLADLIPHTIHALAIEAYSPAEF